MSPAEVERERTIQIERRRFAERVDRALRCTESREALARAALGKTAAVLLRTRAHEHLGFVRLGDYCRERFGRSARQLQTMAQVVRRLCAVPGVRAAFLRGALSWTQARLLVAVATETDETVWLARGLGSTARELREVVRAHAAEGRGDAALAADDDAHAPLEGEPVVRVRVACPARLRVLWRSAIELARRMAGEPLPCWQAIEAIAAEALSGATTEARRAAADCPTPWRHRRGGGVQEERRAHEAQAARATAGGAGVPDADASSGGPLACPPRPGDTRPPGLDERPSAVGGEPRSPADASLDGQLLGGTVAFDAACADVARLDRGLDGLDPVALDARLRAIDGALRTGDARAGRLLAVVAGLRLHRTLGFASLDAYVAERLAFSVRKARALIALDRACARAPVFAAAYYGGALSWAQALCLLPVLDRTTEAAWIARSDTVTVRRLQAEVAWALDRRDMLGPEADLMPPPPDALLGPPGAAARATAEATAEDHGEGPRAEHEDACDKPAPGPGGAPDGIAVPKSGTPRAAGVQERAVQTGAREPGHRVTPRATAAPRRGPEICDAEVDFVAPESVATLWRGALIAFSPRGAPRWEGLARLLQHVIAEWEGQPRPRDPIFARDGFLCTVPGCSGRRNLQDHHLLFRSRGGGHERANRTTVCAAHHLRSIHRGRVRAWGRAPAAIRWDLGVRPDGPPFLRLLGDRYLVGSAAERGRA